MTEPKTKRLEVKVFLVVQHFAHPEPGVRVLAARLNRRSAEDIADKLPNTRVEKVVASK
ncbi:hypothetical protein [Azospirillum argentinense]|uniref:hypothetical protein n=1 Tax=Azospirillum argentinense TaxID=2970906 RepID=UPI0032DE96F5